MNKLNVIFQEKWIVLIALSLLVTLLRVPSLEQPFNNDSGANAYHARLITRGEPLYGTHHPAHHMPAVYYTYALAFSLFGDSVWSVKFMLILWTIATTYLIYRLGVLLNDRPLGALAALFYALLSSHVRLYGSTAEAELFANLPRTAAILALTYLTRQKSSPWKFVFVGLLSAGAFLFKAVYLSTLAVTGFVLLAQLWQGRSQVSVWETTMRRGAWTLTGFIAGLLLPVVYFGHLGLLSRFLLIFQLGAEYTRFRQAAAGPEYVLLYPLLGLAISNAILLILSLSGWLKMLREVIRKVKRGHLTYLTIITWYIFSFIEAGITRAYFPHYYLLIVPPLSLMAAWFLAQIYYTLKQSQARYLANQAILVILLMVTIINFVDNQNQNYYRQYIRYRLGLASYRDFIRKGFLGSEFVRVRELADYVRRRTDPSDYIYYWSGGVQVYYLADRRCPIDIIWPLYAEATGSHKRIFIPQTKYVITGQSNNIPRPNWLNEMLADNYVVETVIQGEEVYRYVDY
jgi:4-amino-4-deoxy-L-arabinose transferase-like glycosyltransferase